jgi:hypothetical protein
VVECDGVISRMVEGIMNRSTLYAHAAGHKGSAPYREAQLILDRAAVVRKDHTGRVHMRCRRCKKRYQRVPSGAKRRPKPDRPCSAKDCGGKVKQPRG